MTLSFSLKRKYRIFNCAHYIKKCETLSSSLALLVSSQILLGVFEIAMRLCLSLALKTPDTLTGFILNYVQASKQLWQRIMSRCPPCQVSSVYAPDREHVLFSTYQQLITVLMAVLILRFT